MDALITFLNETGERFLSFAWPMLWQSSLLIAALLLLDLALRRRVRAVVRYALLLLILVKLVIPPSIASPISLAWWLVPAKKIEERPAAGTVVTKAITDMPRVAVDESAAFTLEPIKIPPPRLQRPGWFVLGWCGIGLMLACWLLGRLLSMRRRAARGVGGINNTTNVLAECRRRLCVPGRIRVEICEDAASPAVFGLFRPVILLPKRLLNSLSVDQLRAVLLHELAHIRRGDVWVNCAQILLQIVYWWHPLLWLANAYIRRVREEAVDETVQVALGNEADIYPTTLVKVAQSIIVRPGLSLGLVSIAEPKSALGRRVKRMLDRPVPRTARLNVWSIVAIFFCAALLLPMARGQQRMDTDANKPPETQPTSIVSLRFACVELPEEMAKTIWESSSNCTIRPNETWNAWLSEDQLEILKSNSVFAASNTLSVTTLSGREAQVQSVELKTVVSGIKPDALVPPGVTSTNENPSGAALETESMRFGSVLDIIPVVDAGTNFVSMSLTASVTEFLGYAESSSSGETLVYVNGRPQRVAVPAPLIRTRLMSLSTSVEDGITLVLGNPMDENGQPVETPGDGEKRLLVFMTPTLIDSQGNRIHERKSATSTRIIVPAPYPIRNVGESATNIPATPVKQSTESSSVTNNSFAESLPKSMYEKSTNPTVVYGLKFRSGEASATNHNLGHTGAARQRIISKLQSIVLGEVSFDAVPLSQAIRELSEAARKADPEETGVSFIINPRAQRIDEPTGLSVTGDLATLPVTINPPLLQVRLLDVLDAIVKVAEEPIQYSIEDYEVVFRQRTNEITPLYTRVFKVDRATLSQGLVRAGVLAPE